MQMGWTLRGGLECRRPDGMPGGMTGGEATRHVWRGLWR